MIRKTFRFMTRNFFDVKGVLGVDSLRDSYKSLFSLAKKVFSQNKNVQSETFDEAKTRLKLTDKGLQERYQSLRRSFRLFSTICIVLFVYSIYLFFDGMVNASILCLAVAVLASIHAFKRHFWMFQMRQQKLGCTFREWLTDIRGKK